MESHDLTDVLFSGLLKMLFLFLHYRLIQFMSFNKLQKFAMADILWNTFLLMKSYDTIGCVRILFWECKSLFLFYNQHNWGTKTLWRFLLNCKKLLKLYHTISCNIFCPHQISLNQFRSTRFDIYALLH